jgi:hypothetical protein
VARDYTRIDAAVRSRYAQEGPELIAAEFGIPLGTVRSRACICKVKTGRERNSASRLRNYKPANNCRYDAFLDPLTPEAAYFLGLIQADGWIEWHDRGVHELKIALQESEWELLDALKGFLDFEGHTSKPYREADHHQWIKRISIGNKFLVQSLLDRGLMPNKSNLDPPHLIGIPDEFYNHFVRGWFDGDGSVWHSKGYLTPHLKWMGTYRATEAVRDKIVSFLRINRYPLQKGRNTLTNKVWCCTWTVKEDVAKIYHWLYGQGGTYSSRKKAKMAIVLTPRLP